MQEEMETQMAEQFQQMEITYTQQLQYQKLVMNVDCRKYRVDWLVLDYFVQRNMVSC